MFAPINDAANVSPPFTFLTRSSSCRVNDWLLKINNVDLTNKDRKQVMKAVLGLEGVINMVVRRRKSLGGRVITPVQINLAGHKGQRHFTSPVSYSYTPTMQK